MKKIFLFVFFSLAALANDGVHKFAPSSDCKMCHTQIYNEFAGSMHANSTPQKDPIHKAIWDKHPKNKKMNQYVCGKCHTPTANNLDAMLTKGQKAMPLAENTTHQSGISCAYCHRIKSIELHSKSNTNIMSKTEKSYFGTLKEKMDSPYHEVATSENKHMQNGNVCIGCHSHKQNKHKLNVCSTNIDNEMNGANCVSCHMPKVDGSVSEYRETKQHSFHGFAGSHHHSEMLTKYVDISLLRQIDDFIVRIDNQTSHALLLHPLRVAVLKVKITRDGKEINMKNETFVRALGKNNKPAMPWKADKVIQETMIKANEKRSIKYDFKINKGDEVEVVLGWFLVEPQVLKKLGLENEQVATKFHLFKTKNFKF